MPEFPKALKDCNHISQALGDWFVSQEVEPTKAVMVMSYLIGVMAIVDETDIAKVESKINSAMRMAQAIALYGLVKGFNKDL